MLPSPLSYWSAIFYRCGRTGRVALLKKKPLENCLECINPTFLISRWKAAPLFIGSVICTAGILSTTGMCGTQSKQVTSISKHHLLPPLAVMRMACIILCSPLMRQIFHFMPKSLFWTENRNKSTFLIKARFCMLVLEVPLKQKTLI